MASSRIFNFLLVLISLYVTVSADCSEPVGDHFEGKCDLTLSTRPSASELYLSLPNFNENLDIDKKGKVQAQRHHVIPFATLRDFNNKLVTQGTKSDTDNLKEFFDEMIISTEKFNKHPEHKNKFTSLEDLHKYIRGLQQRKLENGDKKTGRSGGYEDFNPYYSWIPGNLFIGPTSTLRSDEPKGDGFETTAGTIIPKSAFNALKNANEQMRKYIDGSNADLKSLAKSLKEILSVDDVYPLKKEDWKIDHNNKKEPYSIRT